MIFCYKNLILGYHNNVQCNLQDFAFCTLGHEQYSLATKSPFQAIQRLGCHFRRPLLHCLTHFSYRIGSLEIFHCRQYHALYPRNALNILFTIKFYIFFGELKSLRKILNMNWNCNLLIVARFIPPTQRPFSKQLYSCARTKSKHTDTHRVLTLKIIIHLQPKSNWKSVSLDIPQIL